MAALLAVAMPLSGFAVGGGHATSLGNPISLGHSTLLGHATSLGDTTSLTGSVAITKRVPLPVVRSLSGSYWGRRSVQVGAGIVGAGLVLTSADMQTRQLRLDYLPSFRYRYDDYLQFAPAVATLAMKALGVESRSSWERLVVSDALSVGSMLSVVYVVKYGLGRLRPDGSTHNSFPSGHTAMAFTSATILHKEYGHLSPWVSIAGYSAATVTGISRALNNRHWLSDIVVGAGVGILSTELGYWLGDRLFKDRGLIRPDDDEWSPVRVGRNPSFVGIGVGHNALIWDRKRYERLTPSGVGFSLEGAWFWGESLGVGGQFSVGRYADLLEKGALDGGKVSEPEPLNSMSLEAGIYYNHTLAERWHLGAKTLLGVSKNHYLKNHIVGNTVDLPLAVVEYDTTEHLSATAGVSLRYVVANNLGVRLKVDYNWVRSDYTITPVVGKASHHSGYRHPLTIAVAVDAMLW